MRRAAKTDANHAEIVGACGTCGGPCGPDKKNRPRRFCSRVCVGKAVGKMVCGATRKRHYVCQQCKKPFSVWHDGRKYCSRKCTGIARRDAPLPRGFAPCRVDANQKEIMHAFRACGAAVYDLSAVGAGVPDLLVWTGCEWVLVEVKNPKTQYGRAGFSRRQLSWQSAWKGGPVSIVMSPQEAVDLVSESRNRNASGSIKAPQIAIVESVEQALEAIK